MRIRRILIVTMLAGLFTWGRPLARAQDPAAAKSRVVLTLDKSDSFLGENVLVHYCFENTSSDPIKISYGGDYRGASRSLRFKVTVTDASGAAMPDPDPSGFSLGGIGGWGDLIRGNPFCQSLPLMRYARIDRAGTYTIRVTHDLGLPAGEAPEGRITINLLTPSDAQAEQVVASMMALPRDPGTTMGMGLSAPYPDFTALRYGVYLQPLLRRAEAGDTTATTAIGFIPTPEATRALLSLFGNSNPVVSLAAVKALTGRLPDPALDGTARPRSPFVNDMRSVRAYLIEASWRGEFAADVRAAALQLLTADDAESIQIGAFMLEAVGGPEAAPALTAALTRAIEKTPSLPLETSVYPRPRGNVGGLMRAAEIVVRRGYAPAEPGNTAGGMAMWLIGFGNGARAARWQEHMLNALAHPIPYVREIAMDRLSADVSTEFIPAIRTNSASTDPDVVIAACSVAQRAKLNALLSEVTAAFQKAKEHWVLNICGNTLYELGARFEQLDILASRLAEPDMTVEVFQTLLGVFDSNGYSGCCQVGDPTALSARWKSFIAAHRGDIEAGRNISFDEPDVTPDLLLPGLTIHRPGKPDWPAKK